MGEDFGWGESDIKAAFLKLNGSQRPDGHFHKSEIDNSIPGIMLDFYKDPNLNGEDVYIHFYIRDGILVINSFHQW